MADIDKLQGRTCPKCGEVYTACEFAKVGLGRGAQVNMMCENNHKWSEFYALSYQSCWWDGKLYDSFGYAVNTDAKGDSKDEIKI